MNLQLKILALLLLTGGGELCAQRFAPVSLHFEWSETETFLPRGREYGVYIHGHYHDSQTGSNRPLNEYLRIDSLGRVVEKIYWGSPNTGMKRIKKVKAGRNKRWFLKKEAYGYAGPQQKKSVHHVYPLKPVKCTEKNTTPRIFKHYVESVEWTDTSYWETYTFHPNGLVKSRQEIIFDTLYDSQMLYRFSEDSLSYTMGGIAVEDGAFYAIDSFKIVGDTTYHWRKMGFRDEETGRFKMKMYLWRKKFFYRPLNKYLSFEKWANDLFTSNRIYNHFGQPIEDYFRETNDYFTKYNYDENGWLLNSHFYTHKKITSSRFYEYVFY